MKDIAASAAVAGNSLLTQLCDTLSELYPKENNGDFQRVIAKAGLEAGNLASGVDARLTWHAILAEAARTQRLGALLDVVLDEHRDNQSLLVAYARYRRQLDEAGQVTFPAPLGSSTASQVETMGGTYIEGNVATAGGDFIGRDQPIYGDQMHGDKVLGDKYVNLHPVSKEDLRNQRNHGILRQAVRRFWIDGLLNHPLYNKVLLRLEMESYLEAVDSLPWNLMQGQPDQQELTIPAGARILDVFNATGQRLLILGEPGSGKTMTLLEIARDLLDQAEADPTQASPVVFNLSSWAERRQPLTQWLIEELNIRYSIPKKVGQGWVENDELLLLLDGLDEVKPECREACIEAINQFLQEHLVSLAVCSRMAEYEALSARLRLHGAVVLRPFSDEQIETYLNSSGVDLSALRKTLQQDPNLYEMARSPLLLNIMTFAYQGVSSSTLASLGSPQFGYQHLFDTYIQRMLFWHREVEHTYEHRKMLKWLHWLAARLIQHEQTIFLIERIQPDWVEGGPQRRGLSSLLMLLWGPIYGLMAGGLFGLAFGLIFEGVARLTGELPFGPAIGLGRGIIFGLLGGQVLGLLVVTIDWLSSRLTEIKPAEQPNWVWSRPRNSLYVGLYWALLFALTLGLFTDLSQGVRDLLIVSLLGGLVGSFVGGFREVHLVGWPEWKWQSLKETLRPGLTFGGLVGLCFASLVGLVVGLLEVLHTATNHNPVNALIAGLVVGLASLWHVLLRAGVTSLVGGAIFGLFFEPQRQLEITVSGGTETPNQGIKLSMRYAAGMAASFSLFGLAVGGLIGAQSGELYLGMVFGLFLGLVGGLIGGGDAVVKHTIVRLFLWLTFRIPFNYSHFLDHAVRHLFLRRIGGGYIFIHRTFMVHFAELDENKITSLCQKNHFSQPRVGGEK